MALALKLIAINDMEEQGLPEYEGTKIILLCIILNILRAFDAKFDHFLRKIFGDPDSGESYIHRMTTSTKDWRSIATEYFLAVLLPVD
jgi:hypothetical protein